MVRYKDNSHKSQRLVKSHAKFQKLRIWFNVGKPEVGKFSMQF